MEIRPRASAALAAVGLAAATALTLVACSDAASQGGGASGGAGTSAGAAAGDARGGSGGGSVGGSGGSTATPCPPADGSAARRTTFSAPPASCINPARSYAAQVSTDAGDFALALDAKAAPKTVNNFVVLARYHFYDGVTFHRVIPGFMIQGGDPQGTGAGGPGYRIPDELPTANAYKVGSIAMANTGAPNSGGSQFFIVTGPAGVALRPDYALFGQVSSGMDVVTRIEKDGSDTGEPTTKHTIRTVTITEK